MHYKTALVITSISAPNPVLVSCAEGCGKHNVDFIVIGDVKSPENFTLSGCDFWSIERQRQLDVKMAGLLPEKHYARKNLGYLIAMVRGAEVIIETDDDNFPRDEFWHDRTSTQKGRCVENAGWVNVYRYFTDTLIWPRGFPLENIRDQIIPIDSFPERELFCPVQQGLADENPDVDAVYRLTMPLPVSFSPLPRLILNGASWSPFNSQNTTWFKEAFPLLYIPSYCNFRMCDIWRSFVANRICSANGWGVSFHGPTVRQERNEHNLLKDFEDEVPGFINNALICEKLNALDIKGGMVNIFDDLKTCYTALIDLGVVGAEELPVLDSWIECISGKTLAGKC